MDHTAETLRSWAKRIQTCDPVKYRSLPEILNNAAYRLELLDPGLQTGDTVYYVHNATAGKYKGDIMTAKDIAVTECTITSTHLSGTPYIDPRGELTVWHYKLTDAEGRQAFVSKEAIGFSLQMSLEEAREAYLSPFDIGPDMSPDPHRSRTETDEEEAESTYREEER